MKKITVPIAEKLAAERLEGHATSLYEAASDLIGVSDKAIPADLSSRKKHYLKLGYGKNRRR